MGSLGTFGEAPAADPGPADEHTFGWFGAEVRVHPGYSQLEFLDFAEELGGLDESDPRAITAIKGLMRQAVHPDDFDEFWRLAKANGQGQQELAELNNRILGALADRPTSRPADSSAGPTPTTRSSAADSSSRVIDRLEAEGRPDLALVVVRAQESRSA